MNCPLTLPPELTIYTAALTREAWVEALSAPADGPLCADAAGLAEIDIAGLQLLVSLRHSLATQRRALHLIEPSNALRAACDGAGLGAILTHGAIA